MKVPFLDLRIQYESIKNEIDEAIAQVIDRCAFAGGPFVEKFEQEFAQFCGSEHAVGVGSGTEALWLSLLALGVGRGDEVITVPNTFIATAEAISLCGAEPVFVDIDKTSYNMEFLKLKPLLLKRQRQLSRFIFSVRWQTWIQLWKSPKNMGFLSLKMPARLTVPSIKQKLPDL